MKLFLLFFTTIISFNIIIAKDIPTFKCIVERPRYPTEEHRICKFKNVRVIACNYNWIPKSNYYNISEIDMVYINNYYQDNNNSIPVLTKNLCETFTNVKELNIGKADVQRIEAGAFDACQTLEMLLLTNNHLRMLDNNLFDNLANLKKLYLDKNELTEFSPDLLKNVKKLEYLHLDSNYLKHFNLELLVDYIPDLRVLNIDDNLISCSKYKEMLDFIESYQKQPDKYYLYEFFYIYDTIGKSPRDRDYPLGFMHNSFICVPDSIWDERFSSQIQIDLPDLKYSDNDCQGPLINEEQDKYLTNLDEKLTKYVALLETLVIKNQKVLDNMNTIEMRIQKLEKLTRIEN